MDIQGLPEAYNYSSAAGVASAETTVSREQQTEEPPPPEATPGEVGGRVDATV